MKSFSLGILCLLLSNATVIAQKSPIKFGDIPMSDMTMSTYDKDTSTSAVILADYGYASIEFYSSATKLNFDRHVRIKILKKDGLDWANASIPLYHSGTKDESVIGLKAATYNLENGKIVASQMAKSSVFKEKLNKNINLQKFTLPNVKEGSIIEYSYTVSSEFLTSFPDWQFQHAIPCRHSEFWAIIPDFLTFQKFMNGYLPVTTYEVKSKSLSGYTAQGHHWIIKDVPAFQPEPYMTSESDYRSKINFAISHYTLEGRTYEIMGSWEKLRANLLESDAFWGAIKGSAHLKGVVDETIKGKTTTKEKVAAIHNWVKTNISWEGTEDYLADPLRKVIEAKKGTSGDINILLASMLEKAGVNVEMVLLSTREHGFIRITAPMSKQFNYVVCLVDIDGKKMMLDATEKYLPLEYIPERCLNDQGFIISPARGEWINLATKTKSRTVISADVTLANTGTFAGKIDYHRDAYDALSVRKKYFGEGAANYKSNAVKPVWELSSPMFENMDDLQKPALEKYTVTIPDHTTVAGDQIYFNPILTSQILKNPFTSESRVFPVDFAKPSEQIYMCKIRIPAGYTVDEMPQSKIFALPANAGRFIYNTSVAGDLITIMTNLQINKSLFVQDEYADLREFYNAVVAKQNEQVVLKKL